MINLFAHRRIECKHCGFGFQYTGFHRAAKIVCPACGEENELPPPPVSVSLPETAPLSDSSAASQPDFPDFSPPDFLKTASSHTTLPAESVPLAAAEDPLALLPEEPIPCAVESCPLLNAGTPETPGAQAVAEQLGLHILNRRKRRKRILAWTVTLQICVLCGTGLFWAKAYWMPPDIVTGEHFNVANDVPLVLWGQDVCDNNAVPVVPSVTIPHSEADVPDLSADSVDKKNGRQALMSETHPPAAAVPSVPIGTPYADSISALPPDMLTAASPEIPQEFFGPPVYDSAVHSSLPGSGVDAAGSIPAPITAPETLTAQAQSENVVPPLPSELELPEETPIEPIETADALLAAAQADLINNPKQSAEQVLHAAEIYDQHERRYPESMYWILGNAFASLSWGEPLLESAPAVQTMTVSPDNRYLLTQLADRSVWLWDLKSGAQDRQGYRLDQGTTEKNAAEYIKFVFTPDLRWIIGGQKNGTIRIWDMSLKNPAESTVVLTERIPELQDIQISPNGQWLAAFGNTPKNLTASLQTKRPIQQVNYQRPPRNVNASPVYPVLLWNLRQMETGIMPMAVSIPALPIPVQVIRFSPNSDRLAVGRKNAVVTVHEITSRGITEEPFVLRGHKLGITDIAFAPSGQWIATGSQDNSIRLWDLTGSKVSPESTELLGHLGWIKTLTIDSSGEFLLSGSYDKTIRIWNIKYNRIGTALNTNPITLDTAQGIPDSLLLTPDGDKLVVLGHEGNLGIYRFPALLSGESEETLRSITLRNSKLSISQCRLTSDSKSLIFGYEHLKDVSNNGIRIWTLQPEGFMP